MRDCTTIVRERQKLVRRQMNERHIAIKQVQFDGGWDSPSTVMSYFPEDKDAQPAVMSLSALYRILDGKALPLDLLSLLLPDGYQIVRAPESVDHDALCEMAAHYVAEKNRAHHPDSEAGREIGPGENDSLGCIVMQLVGGIAA